MSRGRGWHLIEGSAVSLLDLVRLGTNRTGKRNVMSQVSGEKIRAKFYGK